MSKPEPICFTSSQNGIYSQSVFLHNMSRENVVIEGDRVTMEDLDFVQDMDKNGLSDGYYDTWEDIVKSCKFKDTAGALYTIYENEGDIWLVPEGMEWDEKNGLVHLARPGDQRLKYGYERERTY